jgi:magnesium chelatase family protein
MNLDEALETTKIHSVAGKVKNEFGLVTQRPFRKPHHTISDIGLLLCEVNKINLKSLWKFNRT